LAEVGEVMVPAGEEAKEIRAGEVQTDEAGVGSALAAAALMAAAAATMVVEVEVEVLVVLVVLVVAVAVAVAVAVRWTSLSTTRCVQSVYHAQSFLIR
jgi:uncharacterized membrane protein